jgi:hypothetical protein
VLRVLALDLEAGCAGPSGTPTILAVARIDVVSSPALGCGTRRLMSAARDDHAGAPGEFAGNRLRSAVMDLHPPDFLVAAHPATRNAIPEELRPGLPWILVLRAWRRLQSSVPSVMLEACWEHGDDGSSLTGPRGVAEREAWFTARVLRLLLGHASPEELEALSRKGAGS